MKLNYKHTKYACFLGYVIQAVSANLAPILFIIFREEYGVSYEQLGRLVLLNFLTQLAVDLAAGLSVYRIGVRRCAVFANIFSAAGLIMLGALPAVMKDVPYIALLIATVIYAAGSGLIEVIVSPVLNSLPNEGKASSMAILHSFYCWGQAAAVLLSTLFITAFGRSVWFFLPVCWSVLPIFGAFMFSRVPLVPPVPEHERTPIKELFKSRTLILAFVIMTCAGASELAMSQWASMFAERGLGISKTAGDLLGPCLFAVLMGSTRVFGSRLSSKVPLEYLLLGSGSLCLVCYALTVFSPSPVFSMIGCAFCGVSVALMWPTSLSLGAERFPTGGAAMFALLAAFGDVGCSAGPWLTGLVSDLAQKNSWLVEKASMAGLGAEQLGLRAGIASAIIFPVIMVISVLSIIRRKRPRKTE